MGWDGGWCGGRFEGSCLGEGMMAGRPASGGGRRNPALLGLLDRMATAYIKLFCTKKCAHIALQWWQLICQE